MMSLAAHHRKHFKLVPAQLLLLGFAGLILLGSFLLWLPISSVPGAGTPFLTALFTATSAVCVTGLTLVNTSAHWSTFGQVVIMILIQIGGLGVMTLSASIYVLFGLRIRLGQRLALQEAFHMDRLSGLVRLALQILLLTAFLELVGAGVMVFGFWPHYNERALFVGLFQAISAFNNAGFDLTGASLMPYVHNPLIVLVHAVLIILGGLGYVILLEIGLHLKKPRQPWTLHAKWVLTVSGILTVLGTLVFLGVEWSNPRTFGPFSWGIKLLSAFFTAVTPRTAGFNVVHTAALHPTSLFLILIFMFIGASPGGTGGGIKTTTFALMGAGVWAVVRQNYAIESSGRSISWTLFSRAVAITILAATLIAVVTGVILLTDNTTFLSAFFETVSAFGTVGLTLGLTPHLSTAGRIVIMLTMFVGRVGPLTAVAALAYRAHTKPPSIRYPEAKIPIG